MAAGMVSSRNYEFKALLEKGVVPIDVAKALQISLVTRSLKNHKGKCFILRRRMARQSGSGNDQKALDQGPKSVVSVRILMTKAVGYFVSWDVQRDV